MTARDPAPSALPAPPVWPPGLATGVGGWPGTDSREAAREVLGELPELAFLPELPARGPHADLTGRGVGVLVDLHADLQPSGWRLTSRPGRDSRKARDLLARDLDAVEEAAAPAPPPLLKVAVAGPWTLAATVELTRGDRALADPGAVADLTESLAEGLRLLLADLRRRLPGTGLVVQLDEPALPAVLAAQIPTAGGFDRLRPPDERTARERLAAVLAPALRERQAVVHCCATNPPVALLRSAGATAVSLDLAVLDRSQDDALGELVEAGGRVFLGVVPATDADLSDLDLRTRPVTDLWNRLGLGPGRIAEAVVCTPACGLSGASPGYARAALQAVREMARRLKEAPE